MGEAGPVPKGPRRLIGHLARQGCTAIRSVARHGVIAEDARGLGCAPGFTDAAGLVRQIAVACAFPRHLRGECGRRRWFGGRWSPAEVVAVAWRMADPVGRAWIEDKARDGGVPVPAAAGDDAILREHWNASLRVLRDGAVPQGKPTFAALAEDLALAGLCRIYRSAASADPAWRDIEVIADACHRLPVLFEYPGPAASVLYRRMLRDAWTGPGEAGRQWMRDTAAALSPGHERLLRRISRN